MVFSTQFLLFDVHIHQTSVHFSAYDQIIVLLSFVYVQHFPVPF